MSALSRVGATRRELEVMEQARRSVATELRAVRARRAPLPERTAPRRRPARSQRARRAA